MGWNDPRDARRLLQRRGTCKEAAHRYYVEVARPRREGERVEPKGAEHPLVAYAASLSKMVYTVCGRTRVFAFPPMGELRRDDDRG